MVTEYQNKDICLYYVNIQEQLGRGIQNPENPFTEVDCLNCKIENQSAISCRQYFNKAHLIEFKNRFERR